MATLASHHSLLLSRFPFRSFPSKAHTFLYSPPRRRRHRPTAASCSLSASPDPTPSIYGGWDELELLDGSVRPGEPYLFRRLLVSIGIDDQKQVLLFFLGFLSALAVSRVRFSSLVVFPVSVLVFGVGFSFGVAQAGIAGAAVKIFGRNRVTEKGLGDFLGELDEKMGELISGLEGGVDLSKIGNYVQSIECVRTTILQARKNVEGSFAGEIVNGNLCFDWERGKRVSVKNGKKRKELAVAGFDFVEFFGVLFQENIMGLGTLKEKGSSKGEVVEQLNSVVNEIPVYVGPVKEEVAGNEKKEMKKFEFVSNENIGTSEGNAAEKVNTVKTPPNNGAFYGRNTAGMVNGKKPNLSKDDWYENDMLSYDEELNLNRSYRFMSKQGRFQKMVLKRDYGGRGLQNDSSDSADYHMGQPKHMNLYTAESEASSVLEETLETSDKSYNPSRRSKNSNVKVQQTHGVGIEKTTVKSEDQPFEVNHQPMHGEKDGKTPLSSTLSVDHEFSQNLKEATDLLRRARECMMSQSDEETTDTLLYKSASLLSSAVAMRPMSLLAVGQLGNTYLLHGELKLKISRELRTLLLRGDDLLNGKGGGVEHRKLNVLSRQDIASVLVEVCEECEDLLVKAGRKYRVALSIDDGDVRALYNWGLALSFRAQLISDIGPEAASDADRVYLAAIDKFDALMSRSKAYAPDALYRWGIALQQRSHLRPRSSREKIKLLEQAKCLFEDALAVQSDNLQAKEALLSCVSELNYSEQW